ncbi:MAG: hypothetical protein MJE66_03925 [Proteobacteria bacterium]|nr:hypothetical protein [Pseudomonadota bacterium]
MSAGLFDGICAAVEGRTSFDRLEARGTMRLALKAAGLEPASLTKDQLRVVLERVLPDELTSRGVEDAASVCAALLEDLAGLAEGQHAESPEDVFQRLGG